MSLDTESVTLAGSGLVFVNYYGAGVTDAYRGAIISAENYLQSQFTNPVTVGVNFDLQSLGATFSAQNTFSTVSVSFGAFTAALRAHATTADDVLAARKWDDAIARGTYPIDIHNPTGKGTILRRVPPGDAYDIPLRCLLPQRVDRLTMGGRCISGTHEAHSSYRVMPIAMATGQAAGVCAALAARTARASRDVPTGDVQEALKRQGAALGPAHATAPR